MIRAFLPCIVAFLLAAPLQAQEAPNPSMLCDVKVSFGSYGMGTDHEAGVKIKDYIAATPAIQKMERRDWGLEGEYDLCLTIPSAVDADKVYRDLKAYVPATSAKAWSSITRKGGETFQTQWPKNK